MTKSVFQRAAVAHPTPPTLELLIAMAPDAVCGCATCKEAIDAAIVGAEVLLKNQCPMYLMQVGMTYVAIAKGAILAGAFLHPGNANVGDDAAKIAAARTDTDEDERAFQLALIKHTESIIDAGEKAWREANADIAPPIYPDLN